MNTAVCCFILVVSALVAVSDATFSWNSKCRWCCENAQCIGRPPRRQCKCNAGFSGNGFMYCRRMPKDEVVCEHCDDPTLETENGHHVTVPYVGTALLSDQTITYNSGASCHIKATVHAFRSAGHVRPRYLIIKLVFKKKNGMICTRYIRICGRVREISTVRHVEYEVANGEHRRNGLHWSFSGRVNTNGNNIHDSQLPTCSACKAMFRLAAGSQLRMTLQCCGGVEIGFRPFVVTQGWTLKSGIYITTPKDKHSVMPVPADFTQTRYPLCLNPGVSPEDVRTNLGLDTTRQAMAYLALTSVDPGLPEVSVVQKELANSLIDCPLPRIRIFFRKVFFMMHSHKFINLVSDSGNNQSYDDVLALLLNAANWICTGDIRECSSMMSWIDAKCDPLIKDPAKHPELAALVSANNRCAVP